MSNFKILSKDDISFFEDAYTTIYDQSIEKGIPNSERFKYVRKILDKVFEKSIQGTIDDGYDFSNKELSEIKSEFYNLLSSFEEKKGIN
ncbi:MAG: hypothetical protein ABF289_01705 [Clostridiales bacterium]